MYFLKIAWTCFWYLYFSNIRRKIGRCESFSKTGLQGEGTREPLFSVAN